MDGMDVGESRKRPLQSDSDHFMIKRSNNAQGGDVLLKQLIPAHLAGVILGKGGETITGLQETSGANIKMSKGNEYYPGTTDRVCLITGAVESVRTAHNAIWQKIETRVSSSNNASDELKVKIVVPNATVGMIIGKGGSYVKQIKDESKAFVQISQKSADTLLVERVVTIAGTTEQISNAFEMVFKMIADDPQSGSCPYISYVDFKGPVANANPNGSPFATSQHSLPMDVGFSGGFGVYPGSNVSMMTGGFSGNSPSNNPALNALKSTLRNSGFSVQASDEITVAMCTLFSYGLLKSGSAGLAGFGFGAGVGQCGLSLDYLSSILAGQALNVDSGNMQKAGISKYSGLSATGGQLTGTGADNFATNQSMGDTGGEAMSTSTSKDFHIGENLVGAVLGRGGQAIIEIQSMTATNIQISKKGVFAPGTRDRIATITGSSAGIDRAIYLIQQCMQQEEMKRSRQEHLLK